MTTITAAVVRAPGGPWTLEEIELDEPRDDELLVKIAACGMCHTDLSIRDQYLPLPLPIVLGHEGAGVVERVGPRVRGIKPGDHVVLAPMSCGACGNCQSGLQVYCDQFMRLNIGTRRTDGSATLRDREGDIAGAFFGQSSFATHALAHQRNAIRVAGDVPLEILGPLGCSMQTGAGTVFNVLRPSPGSSLAVFGAGAVGLAAILAARVAGCAQIFAVDVRPSRLQLAMELGATHAIDNEQADAVREIRDATRQRGVNYAIDTTAIPPVMRQAVESLASPGTCALLGLARLGEEVSFDINLLGGGRTVRGVIEGESVPGVLIPSLIELWRQGRFAMDRLIRRYPLQAINQAASDMQTGETIKPVLVMEQPPGV